MIMVFTCIFMKLAGIQKSHTYFQNLSYFLKQVKTNIFKTFQIKEMNQGLKGLIYKNLQNPAEGGTAPRPMIHTVVICCP